MAILSICSIPGCCKPARKRGWCHMHYRRWRVHGDPHYVVPASDRDYSNRAGRQKKHFVDPEWLKVEYAVKNRRVGEIAAEIGCCVETLNAIVKKFGIPRRDGRSGAIHLTRRVSLDFSAAKWMYVIQRLSCEDIGEHFGVHGSTVLRRLKEGGVPIRHHNDTKRGAKANNRMELNARKVVKEYMNDWANITTVADKFSVSHSVVARILDEERVPRKPFDQLRDTPTGPDHPSWRDDITDEERAMRRDANRQGEWRQKVYERDGFSCQRCGDDRGGNLQAHHIEAHCENKEKRWDLDNGVTLCVTCHRGFHRAYGLKGFGHTQLDEYLREYRSVA